MADSDFRVKNALVVNTAVTINSTAIYYNGVPIANSTGANNALYLGGVAAASYARIDTTPTFNSNVIITKSLSANGSYGSAGQVLTSSATGNTYWANPTGGVTSVATGNGMTGGPITATGTVSVLANSGIVANSSGTFVNTSYIATITSNNSTYLNGQAASYYTNASNISTGTLPSARLGTTGTPQFTSLGVGTAASATTGEIRATNNITAYYASDIRLKTNISEISDALRKVNMIRGVEFDWSDDYIKNNGGEDGYFIRKHDVGVIAQEIESILPEVVADRDDGMKAVKYDRIVALLIQAIKDLSKEVEELKGNR